MPEILTWITGCMVGQLTIIIFLKKKKKGKSIYGKIMGKGCTVSGVCKLKLTLIRGT